MKEMNSKAATGLTEQETDRVSGGEMAFTVKYKVTCSICGDIATDIASMSEAMALAQEHMNDISGRSEHICRIDSL